MILNNVQGAFQETYGFPRVNDRESDHLLKIYSLAIDGSTVSCTQSRVKIYIFDKLLETIEYERIFRLEHSRPCLIETSGAVLNAQDICERQKEWPGIWM